MGLVHWGIYICVYDAYTHIHMCKSIEDTCNTLSITLLAEQSLGQHQSRWFCDLVCLQAASSIQAGSLTFDDLTRLED